MHLFVRPKFGDVFSGVIQFDKKKGYWLVHSVPRFPFNVTSNTYGYPDSGRNNGQVFMCTSFKGDQLHKVGELSALKVVA